MRIEDTGIIISLKKIQEKLAIITILSSRYGVCNGIAKFYSSKDLVNLQPANLVDFVWNAKLENQIGNIKSELKKSFHQNFMFDKLKLYAFNAISEMIKLCFKEHDSCQELYDDFLIFIQKSSNEKFSWLNYIKLEMDILSYAGYRIETKKCYITGKTENLKFVSPKTGKVVANEISKGYETMLLELPDFILKNYEPQNSEDILKALNLTGYFINRYIIPHANNSAMYDKREILKKVVNFL